MTTLLEVIADTFVSVVTLGILGALFLWIVGALGAHNREHELQRACRVCGCTDSHACFGGCYWVDEDLCSSCVGARRPSSIDPGVP